jgi:hypothetical protein
MSTFSNASMKVENNIYFVDGGNVKPTMYPPVAEDEISEGEDEKICKLLALKSYESKGLEPFSVKDSFGNSLDTLQEEQDLSIVDHDQISNKEIIDIKVIDENGPNLHISFKLIYKQMDPVQIDKTTVMFVKYALEMRAKNGEPEMTIGPLYLKYIDTDYAGAKADREQCNKLIIPTLINTIKRIPVIFINKKSVK